MTVATVAGMLCQRPGRRRFGTDLCLRKRQVPLKPLPRVPRSAFFLISEQEKLDEESGQERYSVRLATNLVRARIDRANNGLGRHNACMSSV